MPDELATATVHAAYDSGVTFFDTAPLYGFTLSEHRLGAALRMLPRDSFSVCTKVGRSMHPAPWGSFPTFPFRGTGLPFRPHIDFTYDGIMRQVQDSLQRLGMHRVEALVLHDLDLDHKTQEELTRSFRELNEGGGVKALEELRRNNDVTAIGAGLNHVQLDDDTFRDVPTMIADTVGDELDFFIAAGVYTPVCAVLRHCLDDAACSV